MEKNILLLTDYKGFFGSKQKTIIYNGGMNISKLESLFSKAGFGFQVMHVNQVIISELIQNKPTILYTSSEDKNSLYKSFIEDVIYHLEQAGLNVLPRFEYLKAHNNKVAMELLRERSNFNPIRTINSNVFGTLEEIHKSLNRLVYPVVLKTASGAMSKGVSVANTQKELLHQVKKISSSSSLKHDIKEILRTIKYYKKYKRESFYRKKYIVQNLIPDLSNDWKVLVYGNRCYSLYRGVRKGDFRASGSGNFLFKKKLPSGMLAYAHSIKEFFDVPHISLDIGFDGNKFHLIEFQFLYFGTTTLEKAPFYFVKNDETWDIIDEVSDLEEVYVSSIVDYLNDKPL